MVAWLKRVIRDGRESPEHAEDAETTCPAPSMTEWSSSRTSRTALSATGYDAAAGLLDVPLSAMLLVASCLDRESINTLVSVDPRLRDCLIPELPLAAPRRSARVDEPYDGREGNLSCGLPEMPKAVVREHLIANVVKPSASRCLTSPKAASSLPQELRGAGFELAEEERPQLGEGSFARVSLVVRKDKYYALKTVTKVPLEIRDMAQHMKREVSLHSRLCSHPSIVTLHDSFEDTRRIYMLLEWCPFGSLSETLATLADSGVKAALPLSITACAAAIVVDQLAAAAGYLHDNGVIHRDIKPDNILIASLTPRDVELRLTDFGWSCLANDAAEIYSKCGTPGFAAPEVFAGRQQTTASDIWSIGAVLRSICGAPETYRRFDTRLADLDQRLTRVDPRARPRAEEISQHAWMRCALEARKDYSCAWLCQLVDQARRSRTMIGTGQSLRVTLQMAPACQPLV
ncbi:hypothetical protein FOZ63_014028 [Perkinsus olseni]|uniref:Protein kinase domain-containing protein n=1 Tax=Perkinsus olseni TaxID=32597 RepID=A0A7J6TU32_PEROL|nr:hypothetical protein FOZ63_014028 [Perkinsus olseni]